MTSSVRANRTIGIFLSGVPTNETHNNLTTDGVTLYLYGNAIARWTHTGDLKVSLAGYTTRTTVKRVNEVLRESGSVYFVQVRERVRMQLVKHDETGVIVTHAASDETGVIVTHAASDEWIKVPDVNLKAQKTRATEEALVKANN